jgi:hypothetical protein
MSTENNQIIQEMITKAVGCHRECTLLTSGGELTQEVIDNCKAMAQSCIGCAYARSIPGIILPSDHRPGTINSVFGGSHLGL